ncbi:hypothetical protein LSAT2_028888 [Lamellibrachia satsuma]|nr:hypothetical protein LSAT2_028888 [Lamellibrachia satsuma]
MNAPIPRSTTTFLVRTKSSKRAPPHDLNAATTTMKTTKHYPVPIYLNRWQRRHKCRPTRPEPFTDSEKKVECSGIKYSRSDIIVQTTVDLSP